MAPPMNGQHMDHATKYVWGTLVRGSEEGFATIQNLHVMGELVKIKVLLYARRYLVKEPSHFK